MEYLLDDEIEEVLNKLPLKLKYELLEYAKLLKKKYELEKAEKKREFKFDWEGILKELKHKYTSVNLQHKILELRGKDAFD